MHFHFTFETNNDSLLEEMVIKVISVITLGQCSLSVVNNLSDPPEMNRQSDLLTEPATLLSALKRSRFTGMAGRACKHTAKPQEGLFDDVTLPASGRGVRN